MLAQNKRVSRLSRTNTNGHIKRIMRVRTRECGIALQRYGNHGYIQHIPYTPYMLLDMLLLCGVANVCAAAAVAVASGVSR